MPRKYGVRVVHVADDSLRRYSSGTPRTGVLRLYSVNEVVGV